MSDDKNVNQPDNAERFLNAFVKIEKQLKVIINTTKYAKFYQLLDEAGKLNRTVREATLDIQEYADLRNAIVHQRSDDGEVIAQPVISVVEKIEKLAERIAEPDRVDRFFLCPVKTCHPEDTVISALELMKEREHSKIPVYKESGFVGILTTDNIAKGLLSRLKNGGNDISSLTIQELITQGTLREQAAFISRSATVDEAIRLFEDGLASGRSVSTVLITEHGYLNERPLGIITAADLPRIYDLSNGR